MSSSSLDNVRASFDHRLRQLQSLFEETIKKIVNDRFIPALAKTSDTVPHALERIGEIISESLSNDQTKTIISLTESLAQAQAQAHANHNPNSTRVSFNSSLLGDSSNPTHLVRENDTLKAQKSLNSSKQLLKKAQNEIEILEKSLDRERKSRAEAEKRAHDLADELARVKIGSERLGKLKNANNSLNRQLAVLEKEAGQLRQSKMESDDLLESKTRSFENILKKSRLRISHLENCISSYKNKVLNLESELDQHQRQDDMYRSEIEKLSSEVKRLTRHRSELEMNQSKAIEQLSSDIECKISENSLFNSMNNSINQLNERLQNSITLSEHNAIVNENIEKTKNQCYSIQSEAIKKVESLAQAKISKLQEDNAEILKFLEDLQGEQDQHSQYFKFFRGQIECLSQGLVTVKSSVSVEFSACQEFLTSLISDFESKFKPVLEESVALKETVQNQSEVNQSQSILIESLKKELDEQKADFDEQISCIISRHKEQLNYLKTNLFSKSCSVSVDDLEELINESLVLDEKTKSLRDSQ
ncbi:hypothetical protein P9112_013514 [Eukaryota sp. TZLM1-RC]